MSPEDLIRQIVRDARLHHSNDYKQHFADYFANTFSVSREDMRPRIHNHPEEMAAMLSPIHREECLDFVRMRIRGEVRNRGRTEGRRSGMTDALRYGFGGPDYNIEDDIEYYREYDPFTGRHLARHRSKSKPQKTVKKGNAMRKNIVISLLQKDFTTVTVKFNDYSTGYTYKARTADNIQEGDYVLVQQNDTKFDKKGKETGNRDFKVAKVTHVDETPQIDVDADFDYKWIVQKVDTSVYDHTIVQEKSFADELVKLEREEQRQKVFAQFSAALPQGTDVQKLYDKTASNETGATTDKDVSA